MTKCQLYLSQRDGQIKISDRHQSLNSASDNFTTEHTLTFPMSRAQLLNVHVHELPVLRQTPLRVSKHHELPLLVPRELRPLV